MNIDPSTPAREERDEFDGLPLNPKQIASVIQYLDMSPRDNLKQLAKKIILEQSEAIRKMEDEIRQADFFIADEKNSRERYHQISVQLSILNETLLIENSMLKLKAKPSLTSRIALWFKKGE